MTVFIRVSLLACMIAGISANVIAAETPPEKATTCAACHGVEGESSNPVYPNLAGQHAHYLKKQLLDFRSGKRADPVMGAMAKSLSDDEIKAIAEYYSGQ